MTVLFFFLSFLQLPTSFSASASLCSYLRPPPCLSMRGHSLRSGPRPANSMEQDSFDSYDDEAMEDMLVMSTSSLRLSPGNASSSNELHASSSGKKSRAAGQQVYKL